MTGAPATIAALLAAVIVLFGVIYCAGAALAAARFGARPIARAARHPAVSVLKPLHGLEPDLFENLAALCRQDYAGPVQILCGVQNARDPAIGVVEALRVAYPAAAIELVVDASLHGTNRKVANLINLAPSIRGEVVVIADSDIAVGSDYLDRTVAALEAPDTGAVTCLYHGVPAAGLASRLSVLNIDTHFLPGVLVGLGLGLARPCFGSTIALRAETLAEIGGFWPFADALADDHALGEAVRALGLAVAVPAFTVGHVCAEPDFPVLKAHELRWQRTVRQVQPGGHAGSVLAHPLPFAIVALVLAPGFATGGLVAAALAARLLVCLAVERAFGLKPHAYALLPVRDLLSFGILVGSFAGRRVSWRGYDFRVAPDGALVAKADGQA